MQKNLRKELDTLIETTHKPLAIFDLDGTVFDVTYRSIEIVHRFINQPKIQEEFPDLVPKVQKLKYNDFLYSLESSFQKAGIDRYSEIAGKFLELAISYWYKNFFRDELLEHDKLYPGAGECVRYMHEKNVHIVYLSGRDLPNMSRGTLAALENNKLPHTGSKVSIYLKPAYGQDDVFFKKHAVESIIHSGETIATFDNEPANVKLFIHAFPKALNFHVDNPYAKYIELSGPNFHLLKSFKDLGF